MSASIGVLVCNHSRARLFQANTLAFINELSDQVNPAARLREQDLATDRPGAYRGGGPEGQAHVESHRASQHDKASEKFARDLAATLDQAIDSHGLEKLYVIAEPRMLGLLRHALSDKAKGLVTEELAKDIVAHTTMQIRDVLPDRL